MHERQHQYRRPVLFGFMCSYDPTHFVYPLPVNFDPYLWYIKHRKQISECGLGVVAMAVEAITQNCSDQLL